MSIFHKLTLLILGLFATCCAVPAKYVYHNNIAKLKSSTVVFMGKAENGNYDTYCSGFFVSETEILTAAHCAEEAVVRQAPSKIQPLLEEAIDGADVVGTEMIYTTSGYIGSVGENPRGAFIGKVIAEDHPHDLALVRIRRNNPPHQFLDLSQRLPELGDPVATMGAPGAIGYSYSAGTISNIHYEIMDPTLGKQGPFVQVEMAINPGNSGGAVINSDSGEVVGLMDFTNNQLRGHGFAIASTACHGFVREALAAEQRAIKEQAKKKNTKKN
jgi:S1-C subfamily serine protease